MGSWAGQTLKIKIKNFSDRVHVDRLALSNQIFAIHLAHNITCHSRRAFERIVTLVDICRVDVGDSTENGEPQVEYPASGGSPFTSSTGCWRPVDKIVRCERLLAMAR